MNQKPHAKDLRKGRRSIPGQVYLITAVTHQRTPLFKDLWRGRIIVNSLRYLKRQDIAHTLAFVVMPDHFHWLLSLGRSQSLSPVVGSLKRHTARQVNCALHRTGTPVWQRGFHDHALRDEEDVQSIARYIVANPLRAGLVQTIGDYSLWDAAWLQD